MNVLIVGDEADYLTVREAIEHNYPAAQVHQAVTRAAAMALVQERHCDVVLLCNDLPDGECFQVLADLHAPDSDFPILVLTSADNPHMTTALLEAGASDCLSKASLTSEVLLVSLKAAFRLTETRRQRREALRQNAFYAAIIASADDAVIGKAMDGTILSWNAAAERIYGYTADEAIGRNISFLVPPELHHELADIMARLRAGKRIEYQETSRIAKDGRRVDVALTISPIRDLNGSLIGASTTARDITQRKSHEHDLRARTDREALVNQISHTVLQHDDCTEFQSAALGLLGERLAADRCFYVLYDADHNTARVEKDWCRAGISSLEGEWDLTARGMQIIDIYKGGRTELVSDVMAGSLPSNVVKLFLETGQRSYIAVPFFDGSRPVAALTVMMASAPRLWSAEEVALVEAVAVQVRGEVEWARARQREREVLARQRGFLRDVLASVTEGRLILCQSRQDLPAPLEPLSEAVRLSTEGGLHDLRNETRAACREAGLSEERCYDLITAVGEAGMNAIVHVGEGTGQVFVARDEGKVQVWVTDHGKGIAIEDLPHATLMKGYTTAGTLGHGMKMMLQMADRAFLLTGETGTTVVIEQYRLALSDVRI